jgi:hypothetical protein
MHQPAIPHTHYDLNNSQFSKSPCGAHHFTVSVCAPSISLRASSFDSCSNPLQLPAPQLLYSIKLSLYRSNRTSASVPHIAFVYTSLNLECKDLRHFIQNCRLFIVSPPHPTITDDTIASPLDTNHSTIRAALIQKMLIVNTILPSPSFRWRAPASRLLSTDALYRYQTVRNI